MTGNLAFCLREEGWVPLRFVLVFYHCFEWDRCCGGAGQRKDLHEALGAAGLLMANAISAGSKFHNLGPAPVNVLFPRVMSLFFPSSTPSPSTQTGWQSHCSSGIYPSCEVIAA